MILLGKLFRKDPPPNIDCGSVLQLNPELKRVRVQGRNSSEVWASYDPSDFESLQAGQTVAIAWSGGNAFVLSRIADALPAETSLLDV